MHPCHRLFRTATLTAALILTTASAASSESLPATVGAALRAADVPAEYAAVLVQDVSARRAVVSHNADKAMNPASVMKLVTTLAALELLGPTFEWKTEVYAAGKRRGDVLEGDLVLRGGGDPKLTVENFWLMLRALRARGLREIRGDLVIDRSYFEPIVQHEGNFDNEPLKPYNVLPDALLLNFKAFSFTFVPDPQRALVRLTVEPRSSLLAVYNTIALSNGPCNDWRARLIEDFGANGATGKVVHARFSGRYPASCGEKSWSVALQSHADFLLGVFRQLWEELGGKFLGGVRDGAVSPGASPLMTYKSPPLAEIVRDMNKFSNNVMARQIFLTLSAEAAKQPASTERSARVVQDWLAAQGLDFPELVLENGSGLSRIERISAVSIGRLLRAAYASPVMSEFMASMPVVALDGTVKRRLKRQPVAGRAHIKTGSLADVSSFAGYVLDSSGRRFTVVFIVNHPNAGAARNAQDALLNWIYSGRKR